MKFGLFIVLASVAFSSVSATARINDNPKTNTDNRQLSTHGNNLKDENSTVDDESTDEVLVPSNTDDESIDIVSSNTDDESTDIVEIADILEENDTAADDDFLNDDDALYAYKEDGSVVKIGDKGSANSITYLSNNLSDYDNTIAITYEGEVTLDKELGQITVTSEDGTLLFDQDGFDWDDDTVEDDDIPDDGIVNSRVFDDDDFLNDDDALFAYKDDGSIVKIGDKGSADSITYLSNNLSDYDNTIAITYEGEVTLDKKLGQITVTSEDGTLLFDQDGFDWDDDTVEDDDIRTGTIDDGTITNTSSATKMAVPKMAEIGGIYINEVCLQIFDHICSSDDFTVLCDAINANSVLLDKFTSSDWTLFAPLNSAFEAINDELDNLSEEDIARIILFHGTRGIVTANDLECGKVVEMFSAGSSRTSCQTKDVLIQKGSGNGKSGIFPEIVQANIVACNGIIHVIDQVMLPNFINVVPKRLRR